VRPGAQTAVLPKNSKKRLFLQRIIGHLIFFYFLSFLELAMDHILLFFFFSIEQSLMAGPNCQAGQGKDGAAYYFFLNVV
jgi:hypothetical protein